MTQTANTTFNPGKLEPVLQPITHASGLPNAHYIDPSVFDVEKTNLFIKSWAGLAFAKDLPEAGWAKPVDFLGQPLLVIRDRSDAIRVFMNVCRHRGMILVDKEGPIRGALRCPYHSWCYDLDGALKVTPHVGGPGQNRHDAINRDTLGLIEVRCHIWRDVIFVNLSGDALPFEIANDTLIQRWQEFDHTLVHTGADSSFKLELDTNWKLAVENYCESYHLPWVHPGLNSYSRLEDHYNIKCADQFSGQGTHVYQQITDDSGLVFADTDSLDNKWEQQAEYIALYPNVLLGVHRDHSFAILLEPISHNRTREHIEIYYHNDTVHQDRFEALRARNTALWKTVFEEDIFVVEGMQKGRAASGFDGGRFSPIMDAPTHCFHAWVAKRLCDVQSTT